MTIASLIAALAVSAAVTAPAQAVNTRVSISHFQWSNMNPQIDLGETVTWDWIGPDTMHSVTGEPDNATQWNSNPGNVGPHPLGDTFSVTFDEPGEYNFVCKLHASVRGTVTVSSNPGDPNSDPGPQPPLNFDLQPPDFQVSSMGTTFLGPKGKGTALNYAVDESGTGSADFYQLVKKGQKTVRKFAGFQDWSNHIGNNQVKFANRSSQFKAKPGKYIALVTATDESVNTSPTVNVNFQINKTTKKK
ncbi:MAG: cupredoxin domain-containing protein [Solirubrobacterales bacterium]